LGIETTPSGVALAASCQCHPAQSRIPEAVS